MAQDPSIDAMIDKIYATISPDEAQAQRNGQAEPPPLGERYGMSGADMHHCLEQAGKNLGMSGAELSRVLERAGLQAGVGSERGATDAAPRSVAPPQARERRAVAPVESAPRDDHLADGSDLYDIELRLYGFPAWWAHAQMQVLESMERALHTDDFDRDLAKAIHILERARAEYAKRPREERA